jgi:hypothetical protein
MSITRVAENVEPSSGRKLPLALVTLFLLALSGLFLLAACGGDDEESTPPSGGTRTPVSTATAAATQTTAAGARETATAAPQASGGEIDSCALVTKEEVEAIIGQPVGDPVVTTTELLASCFYTTSDLDGVSLAVVTYEDEQAAESGFQLAIDINDYPEVEGIGDRAFDSRPIGDITVLKGKYELSIDVFASGQDEFEIAKDLAANAADRLP